MKVNFIIDRDYLVAHTLVSTNSDRFSAKKYKKDIINFQNYAWGISKDLYDFIPGRLNATIYLERKAWSNIKKMTNKLPSYFHTLAKSEEFKKIYKQTEQYRLFCEHQWKKNYEHTSKIVEELTQSKFNDTFTIFITHPSLKNGCSLGHNRISWGHAEDWKNYSTVYIWHEILHSYLNRFKTDHVLIELITDNELRYRLNGVKYPPFEGHDYLLEMKKKMLPYWKKYLKSEDKNFNQFRKTISENLWLQE